MKFNFTPRAFRQLISIGVYKCNMWLRYCKLIGTNCYELLMNFTIYTYRDLRAKNHQDKNSLFALEKPADWSYDFFSLVKNDVSMLLLAVSLFSLVNKTVMLSLARRSSWLINSTFLRVKVHFSRRKWLQIRLLSHPNKMFRFPSPSLSWRWVGRSGKKNKHLRGDECQRRPGC